MKDFIYFDYNATTPVDPEVAEAMKPFLTGFFGNPSSTHRLGRQARQALETAREQVARCLNCGPEEVIFTSGGTESNNLALRGSVMAFGGGHIVTSVIEHPAILEVVGALERENLVSSNVVPVDGSGRVNPDDVRAALRSDTILVSVMLANNEVGTVQPIQEIADICRSRQILLHTDAAQAVGKIPVDVKELDVDMLTVAGHKIYAPKGVGALYVRSGTPLKPILFGAGHESGMRPGTENILEQTGLGRACALVREEGAQEFERIGNLRDRLLGRLIAEVPGLVRHGNAQHCLPNTLSVSVPGVDASALLAGLGDRLAASAGAACHSDTVEPSKVLTAMGHPVDVARGTMRLSLGRFSTSEEIERGAELLIETLRGRNR